MTKRRQVIDALLARLGTLAAKVALDDGRPDTIPDSGLVIVTDDDPGEPDITLSPLTYTYNHPVEIEAIIQRRRTNAAQPAPDAVLDSLIAAIGAVVAADRTIGGTCIDARADAPSLASDGTAGVEPIRSATIRLTLIYETDDPIGG